MLEITKNQKDLLFEIGLSVVGKNFGPNFNCADFVKKMYIEAGIEIPKLALHPKFNFEEIHTPEYLAHVCFLKHRTRGKRRMNHMGIIFPEKKILHYSKFFFNRGYYEASINSFDEIFNVYSFVEP